MMRRAFNRAALNIVIHDLPMYGPQTLGAWMITKTLPGVSRAESI
jgi:hypothetical protein